jgi:outer membrane protein, adhesin transport system
VARYVASFTILILLSMDSFAMTLAQAIEETLRTNPDIEASRRNVDAAQQVAKQARGAYLPTVDLVLATGRENSNNTTTRAAGLQDLRLTRQDRSIKLTQLLFDGMATPNLVAQQEAQVEATMARLSTTEENVSLRAIQVYLEVLRREAIASMTKDNLQHHETTLSKIQERFESGVGTKVDVVQTEGRRAQSNGTLLLAQRDVKNGMAEFFRVVGENPVNLEKPEPIGGLPQSLESALETAYRNNPQLKAADADLDSAVAAHKQVRGVFLPRFDLEVGASRNNNNDGSIGANDDETVMLRMTYNLFRGGADKARLNEAEAREFASRETVRSVKRAITEDVTLIWNELEDILLRLQYLEAHVKSTEEVLVVYNEQLSLGKRSLLDLLDVQNELLRAEVAYVSGQYTAVLARYRVLTSVGQLLSTVGVQR